MYEQELLIHWCRGFFLAQYFYICFWKENIFLPLKIHWFEISYTRGWTNYLIFPLINQTLITLTNSCEKVAEVVKSSLKESIVNSAAQEKKKKEQKQQPQNICVLKWHWMKKGISIAKTCQTCNLILPITKCKKKILKSRLWSLEVISVLAKQCRHGISFFPRTDLVNCVSTRRNFATCPL